MYGPARLHVLDQLPASQPVLGVPVDRRRLAARAVRAADCRDRLAGPPTRCLNAEPQWVDNRSTEMKESVRLAGGPGCQGIRGVIPHPRSVGRSRRLGRGGRTRWRGPSQLRDAWGERREIAPSGPVTAPVRAHPGGWHGRDHAGGDPLGTLCIRCAVLCAPCGPLTNPLT